MISVSHSCRTTGHFCIDFLSLQYNVILMWILPPTGKVILYAFSAFMEHEFPLFSYWTIPFMLLLQYSGAIFLLAENSPSIYWACKYVLPCSALVWSTRQGRDGSCLWLNVVCSSAVYLSLQILSSLKNPFYRLRHIQKTSIYYISQAFKSLQNEWFAHLWCSSDILRDQNLLLWSFSITNYIHLWQLVLIIDFYTGKNGKGKKQSAKGGN